MECEAEKWGACYSHVDEASQLDPPGDEARRVQRLRSKANRGLIQEQLETKQAPAPRSLQPAVKASFVEGLAASKGQALRVVCAPGAEPSHICDQLVAAITSAGWAVTRTNAATGAALPHGMLIEVASDADDATQAAADLLANTLERAAVAARGPDDAAPGGDAPLRLIIGPQ